MNNRARYFRHDCNARNDDKLTELRIQHGPAGYGVYFMILERLRDEDDYRGKTTARYINSLAFDFHADAELIRAVVFNFGLFEIDEQTGTFRSPRFEEEMKHMEKVSRTKQESAAKRWTPETEQKEGRTNTANDGQLQPKMQMQEKTDAYASESPCICIPSSTPPHTPPQEYNITENNMTDDDIKGTTDEMHMHSKTDAYAFRLPDETPKARELKARIQAVDWPVTFQEEFMRLADFGENPDSPALQYLALYERDRQRYAPTDNTPPNIMMWLKNQVQDGTLQPRISQRELNFLRRIHRTTLNDYAKSTAARWVHDGATTQERATRMDAIDTALEDIKKGKINDPDAFLISRTKR